MAVPPAQPPASGQPIQATVRQTVSVPPVNPPNLMVQIAAVSQTEDARVLVDALRQRGYTVTARRDPADGLIHVRMGPFHSRAAANAMSRKLLDDGYNAIVQP
ncbi:MAG: SPOR domain-containing protein [Terracidiphilus sp.]